MPFGPVRWLDITLHFSFSPRHSSSSFFSLLNLAKLKFLRLNNAHTLRLFAFEVSCRLLHSSRFGPIDQLINQRSHMLSVPHLDSTISPESIAPINAVCRSKGKKSPFWLFGEAEEKKSNATQPPLLTSSHHHHHRQRQSNARATPNITEDAPFPENQVRPMPPENPQKKKNQQTNNATKPYLTQPSHTHKTLFNPSSTYSHT